MEMNLSYVEYSIKLEITLPDQTIQTKAFVERKPLKRNINMGKDKKQVYDISAGIKITVPEIKGSFSSLSFWSSATIKDVSLTEKEEIINLQNELYRLQADNGKDIIDQEMMSEGRSAPFDTDKDTMPINDKGEIVKPAINHVSASPFKEITKPEPKKINIIFDNVKENMDASKEEPKEDAVDDTEEDDIEEEDDGIERDIFGRKIIPEEEDE